MQFIDLKTQHQRLQKNIDQAVKQVFDHGRFIMGPEIQELEEKLADYAGSRHCICCSSGTDALLMPLMAAGIGPGDAVFTTPFTFFATPEVVALVGATPVFADIQPDSYNLNPTALEEAIEKTIKQTDLTPRAVIAVDLFGLCAEYDALNHLAQRYDLLLIEDAAQAFGAVYKGRRAPALAPVGTTSFFPAKPLGCYGDGGAVFTNDDDTAGELRSIRVHGQGKDRYDNRRIGLNARMDTLQAAILLQKLQVYDDEISRRQQVAERYLQGLQGKVDKLPSIPPDCQSVFAQFCVESDKRSDMQRALKENDIPTAIYYLKPMHLLEAFSSLGGQPGDFPVAETASKKIFALPFHPYLTYDEIDRVCEVIGNV